MEEVQENQKTAEFTSSIRILVENGEYDKLPKIPCREPVIVQAGIDEFHLASPEAKRTRYLSEEINQKSSTLQEWGVLTLALHRGMQEGDSEITELLNGFFDKELEQDDANKLFESLEELVKGNGDEALSPSVARVAGLLDRYKKNDGSHHGLVGFLDIPQVPNHLVGPHLRTTGGYQNPNFNTYHYIKDLKEDPDIPYRKSLEEALVDTYESYADNCLSGKPVEAGITDNEKLLLRTRYQMAREMKLLSLEAKVRQTGLNDINVLESGNPQLASDLEILKDPNNWDSVVNIKDRIQRITIKRPDGQRKVYIMKQEKTGMHADTAKTGTGSNKAKTEFDISDQMQKATFDSSDVEVNWESAVACAEVPGLGFTVFEDFGVAKDQFAATEDLTKFMVDHREDFEQEYQDYLDFSKKQKMSLFIPAVFHTADTRLKLESVYWDKNMDKQVNRTRMNLLSKFRRDKDSKTPLTYEQFADLKARLVITKSRLISRIVSKNNGFVGTDSEETFKISSEKPLKVTMTNYDFDLAHMEEPSGHLDPKGKLIDKLTDENLQTIMSLDVSERMRSMSPREQMAFVYLLDREVIN